MLAFGIGATTAIFAVVDGVLLRPLPFAHADRLVTLGDQLNGQEMGKQDPGLVTGPEVVIYPRYTLLSEPWRLRIRAVRVFGS